jgi:hypothetical protein
MTRIQYRAIVLLPDRSDNPMTMRINQFAALSMQRCAYT